MFKTYIFFKTSKILFKHLAELKENVASGEDKAKGEKK